jgi:ribosomal protein S18 acetylase RimI-like enzyme
MDLPAGHRFRAPVEDDLEAVAHVLLADQRADGLEPVLDAHFIRQIWSRLDFDLAGDAWVVTEDSGAIVAYGQVRLEEPDVVGSWAVVHPDHRRRGIGAALFERIENRARAWWLAILGSHRGRGIGSAMLHRTFRALAARGQRRVMLTVNAENPTGATGVYERAGMRVVNRWDLWERVGPGPAAGASSSDRPDSPSRGDQR